VSQQQPPKATRKRRAKTRPRPHWAWYQTIIAVVAFASSIAMLALLTDFLVSGRDVPERLLELLRAFLTLVGTALGAALGARTVASFGKKDKDEPDAGH
jgi:uncharacterized membrane protein YidH (DUF202 family)